MDGMTNIYEPRMMIQALQQVAIPKRFFHSKFFPITRTHTTETVELDVRKGKRRIAVFVNPIKGGRLVEREGFETKITRPAYTKEKTSLRPQETIARSFGESPYNAMTPAQRAAQALGEDLAMLDERIVRLEEKMCADALLTGKVIVNGDGWDAEVDFGYEMGKHKIVLSGTDLWSDPNSDPMHDLDNWRRNTVQRCGIAPDMCVLGSDAAFALIDNAKVKERLNILNYQMGRVTPKDLPEGISYFGELFLPSGVLSLYSYDEWYNDPATNTDVPLVPNNKVLLGSTAARAEFNYGLIQNHYSLEAAPRFPHSWQEQDGSARYVQLESAPMPNLYQVDAFTVATVL